MTIWTVPGTGYAQIVVNAGDGPTMVINRDETNQVYIGNDNSVTSKQGTGDIDVIDPLSYIVYDGIESKFAISANPNASVVIDCVKGATSWAPSPAQAAQQISLLGLATANNQTTQNNTALATNNALNTGIALPVGASTATKQDTTNTTLSTGIALPIGASTETSSQTIYDNALARDSITPNPDNADGTLNGWVGTGTGGITLVSRGAGLPSGSPRKYGMKVVPGGGGNPGVQDLANIPCQPGQTIGLRAFVNLTSNALPFAFYIAYFDASSTLLGFQNVQPSGTAVINVWHHVHGSSKVPATIGGGVPARFTYAAFINGTPAANTQTFYICNFTAHLSGIPGQNSSGLDSSLLVSAPSMPIAQDMLHANSGVTTELAALLATGTVNGVPGGVPPINFDQQLFSISGQAVTGPGPGFNPGQVNVGQQAWEIAVTLTATQATLATCLISFQWFFNNNLIAVDNISIVPSSSGHSVMMRGPCKGNQLQMIFQGPQNFTISTFRMWQTSKGNITKIEAKTSGLAGTVPGGFILPSPNIDNILWAPVATAIAAGATTNWLLPMWIGRFNIHVSSSSLTSDMDLWIQDISLTSNPVTAEVTTSTLGYAEIQNAVMSYSQSTLSVHNRNAAQKNVTGSLIGMDY